MTYKYYIGIDISKDFFDLSCHDEPENHHFSNNADGFKEMLVALKPRLTNALVVIEATGGYENNLILFFAKQSIAIHRIQPLKSSHYIRSLRVYGKNDMLDAAALARYGAERHAELDLFMPCDKIIAKLKSLQMRRADLVAMRMAEKQRSKHPNYFSQLLFIESIFAKTAKSYGQRNCQY